MSPHCVAQCLLSSASSRKLEHDLTFERLEMSGVVWNVQPLSTMILARRRPAGEDVHVRAWVAVSLVGLPRPYKTRPPVLCVIGIGFTDAGDEGELQTAAMTTRGAAAPWRLMTTRPWRTRRRGGAGPCNGGGDGSGTRGMRGGRPWIARGIWRRDGPETRAEGCRPKLS